MIDVASLNIERRFSVTINARMNQMPTAQPMKNMGAYMGSVRAIEAKQKTGEVISSSGL